MNQQEAGEAVARIWAIDDEIADARTNRDVERWLGLHREQRTLEDQVRDYFGSAAEE
jgi:hypothetical protein